MFKAIDTWFDVVFNGTHVDPPDVYELRKGSLWEDDGNSLDGP